MNMPDTLVQPVAESADSKLLTVAVPSYNVERYLADSLASYCAHGADERLEVLVIDDGSTDATRAIADEFAKLYPGLFRVVSKPNGGHGSAINAGIEHARGRYYRIIDGDDRICTAHISTLLDALEAAQEDLVIDVKREVTIGTDASRLLALPADIPREQTLPFDAICRRFDIEEFFMIHSVNVRTEFLREHDIRLLEHTFYVDYEFIVKIASYACDVRFLDLEVCNYFVGNAEQSVAPANYVRRWGDHTRVTEELLAFAAETELDLARQDFVDSRVRLLVDTHYNIALIYDDDRARGLERAREFRAFLAAHYPDVHAASEWRFRQAQLLHYLGFNARRLDFLMGRGVMSDWREPARRIYHFVKGTFRPQMHAIGAYPLDEQCFVLRFEAVMPVEIAEHAKLALAVDEKDCTSECLELNTTHFMRGGRELVQNSFSITLSRDVPVVKASMRDTQDVAIASLSFSRAQLERLLADFAELSCDAAHDKRYQFMDAAPECAEEIAQAAAKLSSYVLVVDDAELDARDVEGAALASDADFVVFIRQGDVLSKHALAHFAQHFAQTQDDWVYCDTDLMGENGAFESPRFKLNFNLDLLYSRDYVQTGLAVRREALLASAQSRSAEDDAWCTGLLLGAYEAGQKIGHLPHVLVHERAAFEKVDSEQVAREQATLERHFVRRGLDAQVQPNVHFGMLRTTFAPLAHNPLVSIIIPNKDHVDYLKPCLDSIRAKAGYNNYEIIVVENNSTENETFEFYQQIEAQDSKVRVISLEGPFNYSKTINAGVHASSGELLLLLNNDTRVESENFLAVMTGYFSRPEVGVLGVRLLFPDGLVQHAGLALLESGRVGFLNQNLSPVLDAGYLGSLACALEVPVVLGACQMMRRSTFDEVDGYCEELAITCNDIDFCWKVRERGLSVVYTPLVEICHKEFGSRAADAATREQEAQSKREYRLMFERWPEIYERGEGFFNPNLNRESVYFSL